MASVALGQDKFVLKRTAEAGQQTAYKLKVETTFQGIGVVYTADIVEKVESVGADGSIVTTDKQSAVKLLVDGQEMPAEDAGGPTRTTTGADGIVTLIESGDVDSDSYRMANLNGMHWPAEPVGLGSKWSSNLPADPKRSGVPVDRTYEIVALEDMGGVAAAKIAWRAVERSGDAPASAEGSVWVDRATGRTLKVVAEWKAAPISGQAMDASVTIEIAK
jgi:hypothetical protein